jgi:endoglucanase
MYKDDQAAYSLNEIAFNWNAPLVFLLASLNAGESLSMSKK